MALMYPPSPREYKENSLEGIMFEAFKKLSDEYMVFHSMTITTLEGEVIEQSETDFVIFHPKKGILCVEAKAGQANCKERVWYYGNGEVMPHDGPFCQASTNMFNLIEYFKYKNCGDILKRCKFLYAVWFPSVTGEKIRKVDLPANAPKEIIISKDSFDNIEDKIDSIFSYSFMAKRETNLTSDDVDRIINRVLAPSFNLVSLVEVIDNPTPSSGMRHAYEIASDNEIAAVISYTISDIAIPNSLIYQCYGLLMFNIISTSPKLRRGNNPLYFLTAQFYIAG